MTLNDWLKEQAAAESDPECCHLPDDQPFSEAELALAITQMGAHCKPGQHGYLHRLANNPEAVVARDALEMLKPVHPGTVAVAEDGEEWAEYDAAKSAWTRLQNAFPYGWLRYAA